MLVYQRELRSSFGTYLHHVVLGVAMSVGVFTGMGRSYHFLYLLEELSTPCLNMKSLYHKHSGAYKAWAVSFALLFFLCRGLYGLLSAPTVYWCLWTYWQAHRQEHAPNGAYFDALVLENFVGFSISRLLNVYCTSAAASRLPAALTRSHAPTAHACTALSTRCASYLRPLRLLTVIVSSVPLAAAAAAVSAYRDVPHRSESVLRQVSIQEQQEGER